MNTRAPSGMLIPNLRSWRLYVGLGQRELGEVAGVSAFTIRNIENGSPAKFPTIGKLANALGVSRKELLYSSPEPEKVGV